MPKPHYPAQGGPFSPAWTPARENLAQTGHVLPGLQRGQQTEQQAPDLGVVRQRAEPTPAAAFQDGETPGSFLSGIPASRLLWIAVTLTGIALVFTLAAILNHG